MEKINAFYNWVSALMVSDNCKVRIDKINFDKNISEDTLKKTVIIELESNQYIGKFVIWDDNSCFFEIVAIDSEENILHERFDFNDFNDLKLKYKEFDNYFR